MVFDRLKILVWKIRRVSTYLSTPSSNDDFLDTFQLAPTGRLQTLCCDGYLWLVNVTCDCDLHPRPVAICDGLRERRPRRRCGRSDPSATAASASTLRVAHSSVAPPTHTYIQTYNSQPTLPYTAASADVGVASVSTPVLFKTVGDDPPDTWYFTNFFLETYISFLHFSNIFTLARTRCFATFARTGGGGGATSLGVSKRSVVELRGKNQQIALSEVLAIGGIIFGPRTIFDPVMAGQSQIFGNFMIFQLYESIAGKLSIVAAWKFHQRVPRSIMHRMRCFDASRLNI